MEKHFLDDQVQGNAEFRDEPWYNPYGDCIIYQIADEAFVAVRVDELLTVYNSVLDGRVIGFQIKGVGAIIKKFGIDGFSIQAQADSNAVKGISIAALLLAAYEEGPSTFGRRMAYSSVMAFPSDHGSISASELQPV